MKIESEKLIAEFIDNNRSQPLDKIALQLSDLPFEKRQFILNQINGYQKSLKKFPFLASHDFLFPAPISVEQASSAVTAKYKSEKFASGNVLDLTGGMGIDSWFFSENANSVTHIEIDKKLHSLASANFKNLGKSNVRFIHSDAKSFINETNDRFDLVYIDPSRREGHNRKIVILEDCQPNTIELLPQLLNKSDRIVIKTSPMLDIQSTIKKLKNVAEVHILSVNNECREVLHVITNKKNEDPLMMLIELNDKTPYSLHFKLSEETAERSSFSTTGEYLYEPGVTLLKAGMFNLTSSRYNLKKASFNTHLYFSDKIIQDFPGKIWKINHRFSRLNQLDKITDKKVWFISKNSGYSIPELYNRSKKKEGGNTFIYALRDEKNKLLLLECSRVTPKSLQTEK